MRKREGKLHINNLFNIFATQGFQANIFNETTYRCEVDACLNNGNALCVVVLHFDEEALRLLNKVRILNRGNLQLRQRIRRSVKSALINDFDVASGFIYTKIQINPPAKDSPAFYSSEGTRNQIEVFWKLDRHNTA